MTIPEKDREGEGGVAYSKSTQSPTKMWGYTAIGNCSEIGNISSRFSSNSDAKASELLENLEEIS